jgi:hypothetical protein
MNNEKSPTHVSCSCVILTLTLRPGATQAPESKATNPTGTELGAYLDESTFGALC